MRPIIDWVAKARGERGVYRGARGIEHAAKIWDTRANQIDRFMDWPLLAESFRCEAERIRALANKPQRPRKSCPTK